MKILIQFYLFLCVMLFAIPLAAQDSNAAESFFELAKSYEKVKSFKLAAENYMLAGKAYEKRAKEYTTDGAIQKNLQLAVEAYNKAQTMYHQTKDSPNEMLAMKEAMRTNEPLFIKKLEAYKDSITKNPPKDPLVDIKQIPWVPGKKIVMVARASNFEIIVPQALKFTGPRVTTSDNTPMLRKK